MKSIRRASWLSVFGLLACAAWVLAGAGEIAVTTYHYNVERTGWNNQETTLSAAAFPSNFGIIATVALDDQVDTQPLLVPGETIAGAVHDVLYVTTEGNTVYALDANTGQVLLQRNLGAPVPSPLGCGNNGPNVGINGTPVIDLTRQHLYVIAYVNGSPPSYQLHALNLLTLADDITPVTVKASHTLTNATTFDFNATYQRQRPALLEVKGTIYAGFGSFCDFQANNSRGWVMGWTAKTLKPLASNELNDTQATSPTSFFLSSVWMSGFGLASNGTNIFFSTGNSDCNFYDSPELCPSSTTYDGVTNIQESVIGIEPSLATRTGVFTPSNVYTMDVDDADLGAAGVVLMPPLGASSMQLAAIVSKDGRLWLLNQNDLPTYVQMIQLGAGCWCGPAFFRGGDHIPRLITSAGTLQTWQVQVTSSSAQLSAESTTSTIPASEQDPGFFTAVSSNAQKAGTAIIWAVGRPSTSDVLTLYAFNAVPSGGSLPLLYSATAGNWPNLGGNANIVPMVANGKVYVGSYKAMTIFGPGGAAAAAALIAPVDPPLAGNMSRVTGTLVAMDHTQLTLLTRSGQRVPVDASAAVARQRSARLVLGEPLTAVGPTRSGEGPWKVNAITRAKPGQGAWPSDR
jgi:outer membrane protein assembly factor BamB